MSEQGSGVPPWLNTVMKFVLRSPLHGMVSNVIMLVTFTGRKSGKSYTTPVSYLREGDEVLLFTHGQWWKNLRGGAPVTLRIKGKDLKGIAEPVTEDKEAITAGLRKILKHNPRDAKYYGVTTFDADGYPDPAEVARGAQGSVMVRIRLE
ncbi:MAG: nitroreductase family deazaflavin-dependent oxidoreductase [Anaerolineae bacterium]|nr:nitroreductase family deazaflavin-dependent oxidoreductase [Anaerolineae bacterium]